MRKTVFLVMGILPLVLLAEGCSWLPDQAGGQTVITDDVISNVANLCTVTIDSPTAGTLIPGAFSVSGSVSGYEGVTGVEVFAQLTNGGAIYLTPGTVSGESFSVSVLLPIEGVAGVWAYAKQDTAYIGVSATRILFVDGVNPQSAIADPANNSTTWTNVALSGSAADGGSGLAGVYLSVDGGGFVNFSTNNSWSSNLNLPEGTHTIDVYSQDLAANVSATNSVTVDTLFPFTEIYPNYLFDVSHGDIEMADLDDNGYSDLILTGADDVGDGVSKVYRNGGHGDFVEMYSGTLSNVCNSSIALANFNFYLPNYGDLDIVISGSKTLSDGVPYTQHYFNQRFVFAAIPDPFGGGFYFQVPWSGGTLTEYSRGSIAVGDLDGDGDIDMVLTGNLELFIQPADPVIYLNGNNAEDINISFTQTNFNPSAEAGYGSFVVLGDLDGDTDLDMIISGARVTDAGESHIYTNNGSAGFGEINSGSLTGVCRSSLALGDLDGDSDFDLILTGRANTSSGLYYSKIYENDGSAGLSEINNGTLTNVGSSSVALGDLDGDGDLDLVLTGANDFGNLLPMIYLNDGSGDFSIVESGFTTEAGNGAIALGDLDGDGDLDLVVTGQDSGGTPHSKVYRNNFNNGNNGQDKLP